MPLAMKKAEISAEIVEYIVETFRPRERPVVVFWKETINAYRAKCGETRFRLHGDGLATRQDFRKYGPAVIALLRGRYKLTVATVGADARSKVKHGHPPDRWHPPEDWAGDADKAAEMRARDDKGWRDVLARACNPAAGMALFPREKYTDHPLVVGSLDRNARAGASHARNAVLAVDTACGLGTLSEPVGNAIRDGVIKVARQIIEDPHPLFPRAAEGQASLGGPDAPADGAANGPAAP